MKSAAFTLRSFCMSVIGPIIHVESPGWSSLTVALPEMIVGNGLVLVMRLRVFLGGMLGVSLCVGGLTTRAACGRAQGARGD